MSHPLSRARTASPRTQHVVIEVLEDRNLLSAVGLSRGGTLYVEGTRRSDDIVVRRNPANRAEVEVIHDGQSQTFAGRVKRVLIDTGSGNDSALVDRHVAAPVTLIGGAGNDSLSGGSGNDEVDGGSGDDSLVGGAGNDSIQGGDGVDDIEGDDGDDSIAGEGGHDRVRGGRGRDEFDNNREVEDQDGDQVENQVGNQGGADSQDGAADGTGGDNETDHQDGLAALLA